MGKLRVCMVIDTEGFSMFERFHPGWNIWEKFKFLINKRIKNFRYNEKGFRKIYKIILKAKFPVSFMLVGNKFAPISKEKFIDWGYHSYSHKRLTNLNDKELDKEIENTYNCISFSAPMWFIENEKNPERIFRKLKKQRYKITIYAGDDNEIIIGKPVYKLSYVLNKFGLKAISPTRDFNGRTSKKDIINIKKEILANLNKNAVYCLVTHDFSHKNMTNFINILKFIKRLKKEDKIKIVNLGGLVKEKTK